MGPGWDGGGGASPEKKTQKRGKKTGVLGKGKMVVKGLSKPGGWDHLGKGFPQMVPLPFWGPSSSPGARLMWPPSGPLKNPRQNLRGEMGRCSLFPASGWLPPKTPSGGKSPPGLFFWRPGPLGAPRPPPGPNPPHEGEWASDRGPRRSGNKGPPG